MKNQLLFILLFLLFSTCSKEKEVATIHHKIDQLAARYLTLGRFSGTILLAKEGNILFNQSYGLADYANQQAFTENTAFKIGIISELFTAYIIEQMALEKLIHLDQPIATYLPKTNANTTISTLLTATDSSYHLLGQLIEKALNLSFQGAIEKYTSPLGLTSTFFQKENEQVAKGYLFHNYRGNGMELEEAPTYDIRKAFSRYGLKSSALDLFKFGQLSTVPIDKSGYLNGDGFSYTFQKNKDLTVIILSNRRHPVSKEIAASISSIVNNQSYELPLLRNRVDGNPSLFKKYVGIYEVNPNFSFEVIQSNDSLFTLMGPNKTHLIPQSDNQFYYQGFDAAIRFVADSTQQVNQAILYNGFLTGQTVNKVK